MIVAALVLISFPLAWIVTRKWNPYRILLLLAFGHLGWEAIRNINLFGLVGGTVLLANLSDVFSVWQSRRETSKASVPKNRNVSKTPITQSSSKVGLTTAANFGLASLFLGRAVLSIVGIAGSVTGDRGPFGLGEHPNWFGHEAMVFAGQKGFPDRAIVSHIGLAATYIFHNGPDRKVFLDPRLEVASQKTFQAYDEIMDMIRDGDPRWESSLKDSNGNLPVVILDTRLSRQRLIGMYHQKNWRLVYADPSAAVFLTHRQAEVLGLPAVNPERLMLGN